LSRVDHVGKIRDWKQRMDIGKYSFIKRTIRNWNQLPAEALGASLVNVRFLERVRKAIINGVLKKRLEVW
jgi:cytochrome c5